VLVVLVLETKQPEVVQGQIQSFLRLLQLVVVQEEVEILKCNLVCPEDQVEAVVKEITQHQTEVQEHQDKAMQEDQLGTTMELLLQAALKVVAVVAEVQEVQVEMLLPVLKEVLVVMEPHHQ
jgi:hypothetical protein